MISVSDEQRQFLRLDGAPLPVVDDESGRCYMLMPVNFTRGSGGRIVARVSSIRAAGEANQPLEALGTLSVLIQDKLDSL